MKSMKRINKASQRGITLVQALFVLVLGGIALSIALNQFATGERNSNVQKHISDVAEIISGAKNNFGQYNYAGLTTAVAIGNGVIPTRLATSATAAASDWGGAVTLVAGTTTAATAELKYAGVPAAMCAMVVNGTHQVARQVTIAGTDVKPLDGQVDVAALNTQCTSAAAVDVTWVIGRT